MYQITSTIYQQCAFKFALALNIFTSDLWVLNAVLQNYRLMVKSKIYEPNLHKSCDNRSALDKRSMFRFWSFFHHHSRQQVDLLEDNPMYFHCKGQKLHAAVFYCCIIAPNQRLNARWKSNINNDVIVDNTVTLFDKSIQIQWFKERMHWYHYFYLLLLNFDNLQKACASFLPSYETLILNNDDILSFPISDII